MSVLIKGMEMPKNCLLCPLSVLSGERLFCEITKEEVLRSKRMSDCPLVPVPPHGRLIDADALLQGCERVQGEFAIREYAFSQSAIENAPTIIPSDKEADPV